MTSPALSTLVGSRSFTTCKAVVVEITRIVIAFESAPCAAIADTPRLSPTVRIQELSLAFFMALTLWVIGDR